MRTLSIIIAFIVLLSIMSCQPKDVRKNVLGENCGTNDLPKTYIKVGSLTNDEGDDLGEFRDTVHLSFDVFRPCRTIVYNSKYYSEGGELLINSEVLIKFLGKMWPLSSGSQQEIYMGYIYSEEDKKAYVDNYPQTSESRASWDNFSRTGVIENDQRIWMHPFRNNQFELLELTPFPQIRYPLELGNFWSESINVGEGWGEWENETIISDFEIVKNNLNIETDYGQISDCWLIKAKSNFSQGESYLYLYFNVDLGFVKFEYLNHLNQKIIISIKEVIDQ